MKFRLMAIPVLAMAAGLLSQCTRDYADGRTVSDDRTLRPGETPIGASEKIPANDARTRTADVGGGLTTWRIDPNAPKQSNGGAGSEVTRPAEQPAR